MTVGKTVGLEGRVSYYDGVGALRDMVQNHVLQILSIIALEPPARMDPKSVRDEKVKALSSLRPMTAATVKTHSVRGQYMQIGRAPVCTPGPHAQLVCRILLGIKKIQ